MTFMRSSSKLEHGVILNNKINNTLKLKKDPNGSFF
jgi:hypothetical protein